MRIAVFIFSIIIFRVNFTSNAQASKIDPLDPIIDFANCARNIYTFSDLENCCIAIKLIECNDVIGRFPGEEEKDIVLFKLYLSINQLDEKNGKLIKGFFWVEGKYHNPRNYIFHRNENRLIFVHGTKERPKRVSMIISSSEIRIE